MNFVREHKKEMVICNKMKLLVGQKVILQIFFQWVNITCYLSQYVDWIINKINGFFFKKKSPKNNNNKNKNGKNG